MEKITYGFYNSAFGEMVLGVSSAGLCWLGFMVAGYKGNGYERMIEHFPNAEFMHHDAAVEDIGAQVMTAWERDSHGDISLDLHGTAFQKSVWHALLMIKKGAVKSYGDIARDIGNPRAVRAVGTAVGSNPVSLIVPCHRILQKSGAIGNYGWGVSLKRELLLAEGLEI